MSGDATMAQLREGRERFFALVSDIRPELHRYCARMVGGISDGEDIVQETLAHAYYALADLEDLPALRPWLFAIAHNRAIDHLRRRERTMTEPIEKVAESYAGDAPEADDALAQAEAVRAALSRFVELPPAQRSAVILKDVLGHSLEEIAALLELSVPAVKAALHRGRTRLQGLAHVSPPVPRAPSPELLRWVALFNARDWDGVRALLSDDVRLDLLSRAKRVGQKEVGRYFHNYNLVQDWHLVPAWLEGREVIAVLRAPGDTRAVYFVELTHVDGRVAMIRDFRYVPYITRDAELVLVR